ncbi:MAG: HD domain-containing protein [Pseudonocardiaceae bacterium]
MTALPAARLAAVSGMFREVGDLKRVRVAHAAGSVAQRSFIRAWAALVAGADPGRVAGAECAAALAGARLAGVDAAVLLAAGLPPDETIQVLSRAVHEVAGGLHPAAVARAHAALPDLVAGATERSQGDQPGDQGDQPGDPCDQPGDLGDQSPDAGRLPPFVGALCRQPRAGATAPGKPRLIVEPPENHAEHCWAVAVYGSLLADDFAADPGEVWLLGLAHHLPNATLPDAGFAGDILLGEHLDAVQHRLTERELATLPAALAARVRALLELRADAGTAVGRAFHAADVLDRVLQVRHHARAAGFTAEQALVDLELVHAGPVTDYQHAVLAAAGR